MMETMEDASGAGLAAPQVHVPLRLFVFRVSEARGSEDAADTPIGNTVVINPEIELLTEDRILRWEGCLSIPGLRAGGVKKADALSKIGGDPDRFAEAQLQPGYFHCYLELHIEQGGTLDRAGIPIGVVEGIVAIDRYEAEIRGFANHAGTTPMPERHDALLASSYLTIAVNEIVRREPGRQVGTVGQIAVTPNAPNVVPGRVVQTIELRDLSAEKIARLAQEIQARARDIASGTGTEITIRQIAHHDAALATPDVQASIEAAAARSSGSASHRLPSGAGHDAQMMALLGPMGMIFVPSVNGISHSPRELTKWEDCANGANGLPETVLAQAEARA